MRTIAEVIDCNNTKCDGRPFFSYYSNGSYESFSYSEVWKRAKSYQALAEQAGARAGDTIAIFLHQGVDLVASFWGAILGGFIPSILPTRTPKQDSDAFWRSHVPLFNRLDLKFLICEAAVYSELADRIDVSNLTAIQPGARSEIELPATATRAVDDDAFLQHSSGTTGVKKGVRLSHRALCAQVDAYASAIGLDADADHIASWLPLYHDMGLIACLMLPTITGTPVTMMSPFEWVARPASLLDVISHQRCTLAWLPNFAFLHIANGVKAGSSYNLSSLRLLISCSEPAKHEAFRRFREAVPGLPENVLQVCYALAENTFATSQTTGDVSPITLDAQKFLTGIIAEVDNGMEVMPCGPSIGGVEITIVDEAREILGDGRIGEITIKSPFLASGYWKLRELSEQKFVNGVYYTGDLGFLHEGKLYVTGRKDDLINVKGKNLYAHDLEHSISSLDEILPGRVVVLGVYDDAVGSADLVVIAEPQKYAQDKEAEEHQSIRRQIRKTVFDDVGIYPKKIHLVQKGWLLKSTSGKISRSMNLEKFIRESEGN